MWECKDLIWEGRRKTRGSIKDGTVGAQPRCLILFLEEDHIGGPGRGSNSCRRQAGRRSLSYVSVYEHTGVGRADQPTSGYKVQRCGNQEKQIKCSERMTENKYFLSSWCV